MAFDPNHPDDPPRQSLPYDPKQLAIVAAVLKDDLHPKQIGPYEILSVIGEGGMGTVYKARQTVPIERLVAIKVIRIGMDSRAILSRFESERKALALMDHPNVARVLDAGTTDTGRPYFVMEFVDGVSITDYADQHRLSVRDRLKLYTQACSALQHAHQKAIIHRDIKPSNILVTTQDGSPLVKVIDFGVAKATEQTTVQQTLFTEIGQLIGTPEYMSPEQADGNRDIDTRSDVYSLGVVLFELLSGALPFDSKTLRAAGYSEVCRIIREVDPPRPSAKLSSLGADAGTVAERRQLVASALVQQLRSELDWIVIKSLSKERDARYSSPSELAQDIENYLENRPLRAGPESVIYRTRKFVRRNKAGVVGAAVAVTLLLAGVATSTWQAIRATRAESAIREEQKLTLAEKQKALESQQAAEKANEAADTVNRFLSDMLSSVDPNQAAGRDVLVRDVVDRAARYVGTRFTDQPTVEASLRKTLGQTYSKLGLFAQAQEQLDAAYQLTLKEHGQESTEAVQSFQQLVVLRAAQQRYSEALDMCQQNLTRATRLLGADDRVTCNIKVEASVLNRQLGNADESARLIREVIATNERTGRAASDDHIMTLSNLSLMLRSEGKLDEAIEQAKKAYEGMAKLKGDDDRFTLSLQGIYGEILLQAGRLADAEPVLRAQLATALKVHGADHISTINAQRSLAGVLEAQGKVKDAIELNQAALKGVQHTMGASHPETLRCQLMVAGMLARSGDFAAAEALTAQTYDTSVTASGIDHPTSVSARFELLRVMFAQRKWETAIEPAKQLFDQLRDAGKKIEISPSQRALYLTAYGVALGQMGRQEAVEPLSVSVEVLAQQPPTVANASAEVAVIDLLTKLATQRGDSAEATRWQGELEKAKERHRTSAAHVNRPPGSGPNGPPPTIPPTSPPPSIAPAPGPR